MAGKGQSLRQATLDQLLDYERVASALFGFNGAVPTRLLVDSSGRPLIAGAVASDAVAAGNPVQIGGVVDDITPAAAAEANARSFRATPEGNQIVELYRDNNSLLPIAAMPGASEVKNFRTLIQNNTVRETFVTPTTGKKIRLIQLHAYKNTGPSRQSFEIYFGTTANLTSATAVAEGMVDDTVSGFHVNWPDGAGPVGAVDQVLSGRVHNPYASESEVFVLHYREE